MTSQDSKKSFSVLPDLSLLREKCICLDAKCSRIQVYCLSDLHADQDKSLEWLKQQPSRRTFGTHTVFICAGDIGTSIDRLRTIFDLLTTQYDTVCYVPGNHELWTMGRDKVDYEYTSLNKLHDVLVAASQCGIHTGPVTLTSETLSPVRIVPLQSWYHASWDQEPNLINADFLQAEKILPFDMKWSDFRQCKWPLDLVTPSEFASLSSSSTALATAFASLNTQLAPRDHKEMLISFSHFVPRQELVPEKRYVMEPHLHKVIGSDILETQIRTLQPQLHIFGHTHIPIEMTLEGVRYVQWPLGYSREAAMQCATVHRNGALLVYDSDVAATACIDVTHATSAYWSSFYREHIRDLNDNVSMSSFLTNRVKEVLRMNYIA